MRGTLGRRVELLVRVGDRAQRAEPRALIDMAMDDTTATWWLDSEGCWTRHHLDASGAPLNDIQEYLIRVRQGRAADDCRLGQRRDPCRARGAVAALRARPGGG